MFIRNAWYVGAWDHEVSRDLTRRVILKEPVLFYRREDGTPVAIEDRCSHRQAPLSGGRLIGNQVECPYHGLRFDQTGACVLVPSQSRIPPGAKVRAFPVVERNHWIWIWMGDPAKADPALIEDFHWIDDDPQWNFAGDYMHVKGHYALLVDNLLDTTHLTFVHPTTLGTNDFTDAETETQRDGDRVHVKKWLMNSLPSPFHKRMGGFADGVMVDRWQNTTFAPPAFVKLDVGSAPVGTGARERGDRSQGVNMWNLNAITPETDATTHYFWAQAYNFRIDQPWLRDVIRNQVRTAFGEDLTIIQAQQQNIDLAPGPTIDLAQDAAGLAARRIIGRLIGEEQAAQRVAAE